MRIYRIIASLFLLVLLCAAFFWLASEGRIRPARISAAQKSSAGTARSGQTPRPNQSSSGQIPGTLPDQDKENLQKIIRAYQSPIQFCGKVVDDLGNSVSGAKIYYSVADRYFGKSSKYTGVSDGDGLFSISGIAGAGIYVEVSKEGYYRIPEKSYGSFGYGVATGRKPPSKDDPARFEMRRMGHPAPLIRIAERSIKMPKDGAPIDFAFTTGKTVPPGQGDIRIECWTDGNAKDSQRRYSWGGRVSVPGGGLQPRNGDYDFEAPSEGYESSDKIGPAEDHWTSSVERQYFVKTADGRFARVSLRVHTGSEPFFVIESYLNPKSGSTNLEYDSSKSLSPISNR